MTTQVQIFDNPFSNIPFWKLTERFPFIFISVHATNKPSSANLHMLFSDKDPTSIIHENHFVIFLCNLKNNM